MQYKRKKIIIFLTALIAVTGCITGIGLYYLKAPMIILSETAYIYIYPNDSAESVMRKIEKEGKPRSLLGFRWIDCLHDYDKHIKTGKYALNDGDDMLTLYRRLAWGEQTPVQVVVPEVRTIEKLSGTIGRQLMLDSAELVDLLLNHAYINRIGYTPETLLSLFIPNTYEFYWNVDINRFMSRMLKEHKYFWNNERRQAAAAIGLSPVEVATLASIVEEESNRREEWPIIAGLYLNRLKKGMLLQADPTVKFALQDFERRRILSADLEIDSPYNTYKYAGLPPGPIRTAGPTSIESVLHYTPHNYLYMCAKEDFSGLHNFAGTLNEHNANAHRYQQELNRRKVMR